MADIVEDDPEFVAVPALLDCDVILFGVDTARPGKVLRTLTRAKCNPVIDGGSRLHSDD